MVWVKPSGNSAALDWQRVIGKGDATNRNYGIWLLREHTLASGRGKRGCEERVLAVLLASRHALHLLRMPSPGCSRTSHLCLSSTA